MTLFAKDLTDLETRSVLAWQPGPVDEARSEPRPHPDLGPEAPRAELRAEMKSEMRPEPRPDARAEPLPARPAARGRAARPGWRLGGHPGRRARRGRLYRDHAKRVLDVLLVIASVPVTLPLIALMALLVALDGAVPFYRQHRIGRAGRVFGIWKMRTMVPDAGAQLQAHLAASPEAAAEWHATQKLRRDPRITRVGRVLRKTSLDELPQIWNVLTGDMSLIGPRPMMVEQAALYPGRAYYALRPGITGPWQVSDRNDTTFAARAQYDQAYYDGLSLRVDAEIFLRTFAVILLCTGR